MKIAVTGATGFIASRFIELYKNQFAEVVPLSSKNAPLNNYQAIEMHLKGVNVVVHTAFDHYYQHNIQGLKNIIQACQKNKVQKLVFLSTVSVYDPNIEVQLTENSAYSSYHDPYAKEKIHLEKILTNVKGLEVIILQPTIVYGLGGAWTKYAINACKHQQLMLPNQGTYVCNAVYVDDVAQAIFKATQVQNISFAKFLISGNEQVTWKLFYQLHHQALSAHHLPSDLSIGLATKSEFHSKSLFNMIFQLWFKTKLHVVFDTSIKLLKKMREKKYAHYTLSQSDFLKSELIDKYLEPVGITKKVHHSNFVVNITLAREQLGYQPMFDLNKAQQQLIADIGKLL